MNDLPSALNTIQEHKIFANGPALYLGKNITEFCTVENVPVILFNGLNVLLYIHTHFINPNVKHVRKYRFLNATVSKTY